MDNTISTTKVHENLSLNNLPNEIWKNIPGYKGIYQVSAFGRVKSLKRVCYSSNGQIRTLKERIMKPYVNKYPYAKFGKKHFGVHQLVAMAFLNHVPCGYEKIIDHKDNDKLNNHVDNLQIVSVRHNCSKDKKGHSSKYVGVHWHKRNNVWCSRIFINGKRVHVGSFKAEYKAHLAYQNRLNKI